ncbi:MAG: hypothetical protein CVV49_16725 [Spirochaetae bacterium HGW-Spirochaetae-5]|jgi:hypothetical protein|nr:MAG: hypothetical protein CVV49_16725 [Spirochaetae bacterium HGW-Spirochaetae-5]
MEHYKIVIGSSSIEISSHDKNWVEEKIINYKDLIERFQNNNEVVIPSQKMDTSIASPKRQIVSNMPMNEFYRKFIHSKIKSRPDIATFFVYYLTKVEDKKDVGANEVKEMFKEVKYPNWNKLNIPDILGNAKKKALLNSVNGQWSMTISGEDFILNSMSENNG